MNDTAEAGLGIDRERSTQEPEPQGESSVWRCFHCGDVFTRAVDAAEHFGGTQGALAGCEIKGHEHGLLGMIRDQEHQLARWREEIDPLTLAMGGMRAEHAVALRRAEEIGYDRGVRDMLAESRA
jgi:hypothetical protein